MNFEPIDGQYIHFKMDREEFVRYITAWEIRAVNMGIEKFMSGDLKENQFSSNFHCSQIGDKFYANMGPSRRAGGGGIWMSGWIASFVMESDLRHRNFLPGQLMSLQAFCDDFNTFARKGPD
jgi:hypothetical protein